MTVSATLPASAPPRTTSAQSQLRRHIFGDVAGTPDKNGNPTPVYIALFSGKRKRDGSALHSTTSTYFKWPLQSAEATRWIQSRSNQGMEVYQCAHLVTGRRRVKANAAQMMALYVDGDGAQPGPDLPQPTAVVESSPGRHQFYWRLTRAIDPVVGEQLNKRLANAMQADMSGWDLTQLLRPPDTHNWKYDASPTVHLLSIEDRAYDPDELDRTLPHLRAETAPRAEVKLERSAAATPIGDRDQRARERMYAAQRGSEIQMLANGGSVRSKPEGGADVSADDLSYASGLAFWFDKHPSRIAAEMWRSARVRDKWHEVHASDGSTYLEMTIGKAIASCSQSFRDLAGYDAGDDQPTTNWFTPSSQAVAESSEDPIPGEPTTLEEALVEIGRLQRRALDQDDRIEMMTGIIADQQAVIAATRAERDQLTELRSLDRRVEMAKQRIRRSYKPGQADAIIAVAQIAPPIANAHRTDEPIITREMIAETNGSHPGSAGENAKVFDQPGSPIQRTPVTLGTKSLTAYKLGGLGTVEILEQMADLGESLDRAAPTRAKRVRCERCPDGTTQTAAIICDGCGGLLSKHRVTPPPPSNVSETRALETTPPSVDDYVTLGTRNARVAGHLEQDRKPVNLGTVRMTRPQERPVKPCLRPGCGSPCGPGDDLLCIEHRAEANAPAAIAGGEI